MNSIGLTTNDFVLSQLS